MIVITNDHNSTRLQTIATELLLYFPALIQQRITSTQIYLTDDLNVPDLGDSEKNKLLKMAYNEGFGCVLSNYVHSNVNGHLLVLNLSLANQIPLSNEEIFAALAHELGHIFNNPIPREIPSILHGASMSEIDEVRKLNRLDLEIYADHFAKTARLESALISSFNKYSQTPNAQNTEMFELRKIALLSNDVFTGSEKQLRV